MSYQRKQQDKKRYKNLEYKAGPNYPRPVYFDTDHYVRFYKSNDGSYRINKKITIKKSRRVLNRKLENIPYKKISDLIWNTW